MKNLLHIFVINLMFTIAAATMLQAAEEGALTVITEPEGVEVWLEDKYIGDSPIENKKLKTGHYKIKLIDPIQQVSTAEDIFIQAGKTTTVEKVLGAKFGTLKVESEPEGAEVYISTPLGKTPLVKEFMNPGKYRIEIKHPKEKYTPVVEEITIPSGKKVELSNTLEKTTPFNKKALLRAFLGAGAAAGFVWAVIEQGYYKEYETDAYYYNETATFNEKKAKKYDKKADSAGLRRTIGIIVGSVCVVGFEIVAFF